MTDLTGPTRIKRVIVMNEFDEVGPLHGFLNVSKRIMTCGIDVAGINTRSESGIVETLDEIEELFTTCQKFRSLSCRSLKEERTVY
jgi:hypothetical protein